MLQPDSLGQPLKPLSEQQVCEVKIDASWHQKTAETAQGKVIEESVARHCLPADEPPALPTRETHIVDAEHVPERGEEETHAYRPSAAVRALGHPGPPNAPADKSASPKTAPVTPPPPMLTYDEAPAVMRASRSGGPGRRRVRRR